MFDAAVSVRARAARSWRRAGTLRDQRTSDRAAIRLRRHGGAHEIDQLARGFIIPLTHEVRTGQLRPFPSTEIGGMAGGAVGLVRGASPMPAQPCKAPPDAAGPVLLRGGDSHHAAMTAAPNIIRVFTSPC
jgi:hypothetical protein